MNREPLRERCRGRWDGILPALGIDSRFLTRKNGPCPLCPGGKDRWRFLDTDGVGTWICTQCGAGNGIDLVLRFTGLPFCDAARRIEAVIGDVQARPSQPPRSESQIRAGLNAMWRAAAPIRRGDVTDEWLRSRAVVLDAFPPCLRSAPRMRYYDKAGGSYHPAMLAMVTSPDGKPATIHRTYLARAGAKAAVHSPRKLYSAMPKGAAVRLAAPGPTLGIAEGIETALAAQILFGFPTWAAICANGLASFEPPATTKRLLIFADNDGNAVGQKAAATLGSRMAGRLQVETVIPDKPGQDWNDILRSGGP
jgi:putative DNA primase/helicase